MVLKQLILILQREVTVNNIADHSPLVQYGCTVSYELPLKYFTKVTKYPTIG